VKAASEHWIDGRNTALSDRGCNGRDLSDPRNAVMKAPSSDHGTVDTAIGRRGRTVDAYFISLRFERDRIDRHYPADRNR
jgi:hypothetical protein